MAFDGDPLTCYASANLNNAWVGLLILGKKTEINKIRFVRGDDNSVREGDEYELKSFINGRMGFFGEDKLR